MANSKTTTTYGPRSTTKTFHAATTNPTNQADKQQHENELRTDQERHEKAQKTNGYRQKLEFGAESARTRQNLSRWNDGTTEAREFASVELGSVDGAAGVDGGTVEQLHLLWWSVCCERERMRVNSTTVHPCAMQQAERTQNRQAKSHKEMELRGDDNKFT